MTAIAVKIGRICDVMYVQRNVVEGPSRRVKVALSTMIS